MYKRIDFSKLEGLATYQDTLDFLQTSYREAISAIAKAFGSRVIITGVLDQGTTYSDGWVVIDDNLMPFAGGLKTDRIVVEDLSDTEIFNDGSIQTVYYTKRAKLGVTGGYPFSDFIRVDTMSAISVGLKNLVTAHNNLQNAFNVHTHTWDQILNKPGAFPPIGHTHPWDQVTGKPAIPTYYFGTNSMGNGDSPGDGTWTCFIPDQGTTDYRVAGTLVSIGNDGNFDNDVFWMIRNKTRTSFELWTKDVTSNTQHLRFEYMIVKF